MATLNVDNIKVNGNTISSTNTDGDINLTPNGTGKIVAAAGTAWEGTVSQSSTSSIVERGSNTNGEYVKFADGTMICHNAVSVSGSIVDSGVASGSLAMPVSFSTTSGSYLNVSLSGSAVYIIGNYLSAVNTGTWTLRNDSGATRPYQISSFFAFGRWY